MKQEGCVNLNRMRSIYWKDCEICVIIYLSICSTHLRSHLMSVRTPMKHRRTRSSNDLNNLLMSPPSNFERKLVKVTSQGQKSSSPPRKDCHIVKLVKASTKRSQQKIVLVQNLEANFLKTQFTDLQFGKNPYKKNRRHCSDMENLALFSIPEANSTLDTVAPKPSKICKKPFLKTQPRPIKKTINLKPAAQPSNGKQKNVCLTKSTISGTTSSTNILACKSKLLLPTQSSTLKRRAAQSYF